MEKHRYTGKTKEDAISQATIELQETEKKAKEQKIEIWKDEIQEVYNENEELIEQEENDEDNTNE